MEFEANTTYVLVRGTWLKAEIHLRRLLATEVEASQIAERRRHEVRLKNGARIICMSVDKAYQGAGLLGYKKIVHL